MLCARLSALVLVVFAGGWPALGGTLATPGLREQNVASFDGTMIRVLDGGTKGGRTLLFVPGWTMPAEIWAPQLAHFAGAHRVAALDPRGQGGSDKPRDGYFPTARARDIKAVVETLHLAPVVLVGWSMGVTEALSFVDQFGTSDLTGLVLVDGIAGGEFEPGTMSSFLTWLGALQRDRSGGTRGFVRSMFNKPHDETYLAALEAASKTTPTDAMVALAVGMLTTDNRPVFGRVDRPTLIVVTPGPFSSSYEAMHAAIRGSRLETFQEAGHGLFVDEPERFNALMADFLASVPPPTATP